MIAAVVPVKAVDASKSRLRDDYDADAVERLATAMLRDVLAALTGARSIERVVVATPDALVARIAREAGADTIVRDDPGLNAAVERAAADLAAAGADAVLVMLGDVAGARSEDIDRLVALQSGDGVALAASGDGGTAALLLRPHDVIATAFGPGSAAAHRDLAVRAGVPLVEIRLPSLAIDVDRRDDLESLLASDAPAIHTRAVCRTLVRGTTRD